MRWILVCLGAVAMSFAACARTAAPMGNGDGAKVKSDTAAAAPIRISADGVTASEPAVARSAGGAIFVVYLEHSDENADVFVQRLDAAGKFMGEKVRVNPVQGQAKGWRGDPPTIAVSGDDKVYIGWTRKSAGAGHDNSDIVLSASADGGHTFSEPARVNDDAQPASHGLHSLAVDETGRIHLAWLDGRNVKAAPHATNMSGAAMQHDEAEPNSEVFYSYSSDGGKAFAANRKLASNVCPCCKTSLLAAADNTIYAAWRQVLNEDHRHIAVAHSIDGGATFSEGVIVSDDNWQIHACPVSGAALASTGANTVDVVWYTAGEAGQAGVYFARSTDAGRSFAPRTLVSSDAGRGTPVLLTGDSGTTAVFPAIDGGTLTASWSGTPETFFNITNTPGAAVPTAAPGVAAFVNDYNGKSAVWVRMAG